MRSFASRLERIWSQHQSYRSTIRSLEDNIGSAIAALRREKLGDYVRIAKTSMRQENGAAAPKRLFGMVMVSRQIKCGTEVGVIESINLEPAITLFELCS